MIAWWLLAWLGVGRAAEVAVVGVHDGGRTVAEATALVASMRAAVELSGAHQALGTEEITRALAGREELVLQQTFLSEGRRLLEDGRILYQQAQPDAIAVLEAAVVALEEGAALTGSVRELWDAWMLLATARLGEGGEVGARDALGAALALQPERVPDPASFPPDVIALFRAERDLVLDEVATLTVAVEGEVDGASVWLDGREIGAPPVSIEGVLPGEHFVHVRAAGAYGARQVVVKGGAPVSAQIAVGAPALGVARASLGGRTQQIAALYRALATHTRADLVLVAGRVDGVMQLQLFDRRVDAFGPPTVLSTVGSTEEVVDGVARMLAGLTSGGTLDPDAGSFVALPLDIAANPLLAGWLLTPPPGAAPVPPMPVGPVRPVEREPRDRDGKKIGLYVGVGVGAAVVVATATVLGVLLSRERSPEEVAVPTGTIVVGPPRTAR